RRQPLPRAAVAVPRNRLLATARADRMRAVRVQLVVAPLGQRPPMGGVLGAVGRVVRLVLGAGAVAVRPVRIEPPLPLLQFEPHDVALAPGLLDGQVMRMARGILAAHPLITGARLREDAIAMARVVHARVPILGLVLAGRAPPRRPHAALDGMGAVGADPAVPPVAARAARPDRAVAEYFVLEQRPALPRSVVEQTKH